MAKESAKTKSQTLSVGETAKRLDVSPDSVRNYCERGSLRFLRLRGYPNELNRGYICNLSFFKDLLPGGFNPSTILGDVGRIFGGGTFKILRIRDGEVISERIISVPGPTKDDVAIMREVYMDL